MSIHIPVPETELIQLPSRLTVPELLVPNKKPVGPVEIDWSLPITDSLKFCYLPQGRGDRDLVSQQNPSATAGTPILSPDKDGLALVGDGDDGISFSNVPVEIETGPFTFWALFKWDGTTTGFQTIMALDTTSQVGMYHWDGTASRLATNSFDMSRQEFSDLTLTANVLYACSVSCIGIINPGVAYLNGETQTSAGNFDYDDGGSTKGVEILTGQGGQFGNGRVYMALVFNRVLTNAEQLSLYRDPYQFLKPAVPVFFPAPELEFLPLPQQVVPTKKPASRFEIDWDNLLTKGLIKAFFFIGGDYRDYVNNDAPILNTTAFDTQGLKQVGTSEHITWPSTHFSTALGSLVFDFTSNGNAQQTFCELVTTAPAEFRLARNGGTSDLSLKINDIHGELDGFAEIWDQTQHKISAQWDASANFRAAKVDNIEVSSATAFTEISVAGDIQLLNKTDGGRQCEGDMTYCLVFDRVIPMEILDALHENPYQILKPVTPTQIPYEPNEVLDGFWLSDPRFEMPELLIPKRKPQGNVVIDVDHPMAKGLQSFGLDAHDLVGKRQLNYFSNSADQIADYLHFNDTRNSEALLLPHLGNTWLDGATEFTLMVICRFHGTANADEDCLIGQWSDIQSSTTDTSKRAFLTYDSLNDNLELNTFVAGDVTQISSQDLDDNKFHTLVGTLFDGLLYIFVDGVQVGGTTASGALQSASHSKVPEVMGGHKVTNATIDSGRYDLKAWGIWERGMSASEIEAMAINPYQFLIPA